MVHQARRSQLRPQMDLFVQGAKLWMLLIIGTGQSGMEFQLVAGKHVIALVEALNGFRGGRKRLGREILQERQADEDGQQDEQRKVGTPCRGRMPRQQKRDP